MYLRRLFVVAFFVFSFPLAFANSLADFARHAQFIDVKISPLGNYLAATMRSDDGRIELIVLDITQQMKAISRASFADDRSIHTFHWANNDRIVFTLSIEAGSKEQARPTGELFAINPDGRRQLSLFGPNGRDKDRASAQVIDWLPEDDKHIIISTRPWTRSETYTTVYRLNIDTGRKRQLARPPLREAQVLTDFSGQPRLAVGVDVQRDNEIVILFRGGASRDWREIKRYDADQGGFEPLAFLSKENKILGLDNRATDTKAIITLDLDTAEEKLLFSHPEVDVSPIVAMQQGVTGEVIGAFYESQQLEYHFFDQVLNSEFRDDLAGLVEAFEQRMVQIASSTADGQSMIVTVSSADEPSQFYLFDRTTKQVQFLTSSRPWLDTESMPKTHTIVYEARDGQKIHALLTLPNDATEKLPLILMPHGGPIGVRDSLFFNREVKVLAQHGYAVLQPNFRGSGGFGRSFQAAGYQNWGTVMIDDMTDGVNYLIEQGIADKNRVCSSGASYGGYAALMSAIREPELYKCVIAYVGVYDLEMLFDTGDIPERQSGLNFLERTVGRDPDIWHTQSPLRHIDKLEAPVFIVHGEKDQRATIDHALALKKELEKNQHPYQWLVKENEGHGFYIPENNIELWSKLLEFLSTHLSD